jgi:hypothetical protein
LQVISLLLALAQLRKSRPEGFMTRMTNLSSRGALQTMTSSNKEEELIRTLDNIEASGVLVDGGPQQQQRNNFNRYSPHNNYPSRDPSPTNRNKSD